MKQVVLITGASSGIGKETARVLRQKGFVVYGAARRIEKMQDLEQEGIRTLKMDLVDNDSIESGIERILQEEGTIDVLINNAGYGSYGSLEDTPIEEAKVQFEVNVFGLARLTQLVLPHMRKKHSGKIINVSSIGGKIGEPHGAWYHATKFAVEGLSDSLRLELKQFGIQVIVIQPGAIKTEWNGIARENLLKVSGNTAYKDLVQKHVKMLARADEKMGSDPIVIARAIAKAVMTKNPRTRYAAGAGAKPILFLRKILSDKLFDRLLLSQVK